MGKNDKNLTSKMYKFSTMQNISMKYELYEEVYGLEENRGNFTLSQLVRKILRKQIKRFME